ncbi:MAG TPA: proteasome subunit alpha [Mycobacteriales bacterium]|nr:proteasome subunit alpha [Mycobacteriales bacterium]
MTMPFYASPEQVMRDRSEYARKNIARGRDVVVFAYAGGVLFVAENSTTLHKIGELYDRIGFAAVGRYNEYENLRVAGVRLADTHGYSYDRRDVNGRVLANAYARTLGSIFTEQLKPFEVEICVAEVGDTPAGDQLYRLIYDGSIVDEPDFVVMGGHAAAIATAMRERFRKGMDLGEAIGVAVRALESAGGDNGTPRQLSADQLEVAILDRNRPKRTFHRITGDRLSTLLPGGRSGQSSPPDSGPDSAPDSVEGSGPDSDEPPTGGTGAAPTT